MEYRKISTGDSSPTYVLVFVDGDEATTELLRFARETGTTAAHVSGIGAASSVKFAILNLVEKRYDPIELREQVEVLSILGNLALGEDGKPLLHAHVVVAKADGSAHGGHLLELSVQPTLELFVSTAAMPLPRRRLRDLPLATIRLSESS